LEASAKINDLGCGIPIVAMTANIMSNDKEVYAMSGMSDHIGKPFTSQELWRCLLKYFTPLNWQEIDKEGSRLVDNELRQKLIANFIKNNTSKIDEITNALNAGEIVLAHRLAHTLASNAGQLDKYDLQRTSEDIEYLLKDGKNKVTLDLMLKLQSELADVLTEFANTEQEDNSAEDNPASENFAYLEDESDGDHMEITGTKKSILLVDDDSSNLMELTHLLRSKYKLRAVRDGVSALKNVNEHIPDIILLDVIMPEMDGFEVLKELKKAENTKNIPVILITGKKDNVSESEGFALGAVDYIRKPFDAEDVILRVKNHLEIANLKEKDW